MSQHCSIRMNGIRRKCRLFHAELQRLISANLAPKSFTNQNDTFKLQILIFPAKTCSCIGIYQLCSRVSCIRLVQPSNTFSIIISNTFPELCSLWLFCSTLLGFEFVVITLNLLSQFKTLIHY